MTDTEFTEFVRLLQLWANEMDQWEMRKFESEYGTMYFTLSMEPLPGTEEGHYEPI